MIYFYGFCPEGCPQPQESTNMSVVQDHTDAYKPNDSWHHEFSLLGWLEMINLVSQPIYSTGKSQL